MKNLYIIILLCLLIHFGNYVNAFAQENSSNSGTPGNFLNDSVNKQLQEINATLSELKNLIKNNMVDESMVVGYLVVKQHKGIILHKDSIVGNQQFKRANNPEIKINLDSIVVITKNGYIVDLQVVSNHRTFTNFRAPIALTVKRINKGDKLWYVTPFDTSYILASDIFQFIVRSPYLPEDDEFVFDFTSNKLDTIHVFKKDVGLNTIFDIRVYSDLLAVLGGKPNGLFQTDANLKQVLNRTNIKNFGIFLMQYFKFNLSATKFDSKSGVTDSINFNRSSLVQKSWLTSEVTFNLINEWVPRKSMSIVYLDFGGGINLSNFARKSDTITTTSYSLIVEPGYEFKVADNIGINLNSRFFWNWSPQMELMNQESGELFIRPSFGIFWNPLGNKANRLFGRVIYTVDTRDAKNSFFQVQFGYSLVLSKLISK
jgi:hypothetical protein